MTENRQKSSNIEPFCIVRDMVENKRLTVFYTQYQRIYQTDFSTEFFSLTRKQYSPYMVTRFRQRLCDPFLRVFVLLFYLVYTLSCKNTGEVSVGQLSTLKSRDSLCTRSAPLPNAIASHLSESGHFLRLAERIGTSSHSVPCAGGLARSAACFRDPHSGNLKISAQTDTPQPPHWCLRRKNYPVRKC